jgi:glycosyltransferase involved in cell wall biosynthesis
VLGDVVPNKQVDMVVRAVAEARRGGAAVELDIVGEADLAIRDLVRTLGLADAVRVHGRVGQDAFVAALARADLCIVWRDPTMGETSGVASRALQIGVPLVVHRIGWYGELPDPVVKLDGHDAERSLARLLHRLATDPASHARLVHEAGVLADTLAAQDRTIEDLLAFLRSVASGAELLDEVGLARTASVLAAVGVTTDPEDAVLRRQALDRVGPVIGYVTAPDPFRDVPLFSAGG